MHGVIGLSEEKKLPQMQKKKDLFHENKALSQMDKNYEQIVLQFAFPPAIYFRSGTQWLLTVCRFQNNAPGKEVWLKLRGLPKLKFILN